MHRIKLLAITSVMVLVAGAFLSSQAQKKMSNHRMPPPMPPVYVPVPLSGTYVSNLTTTEVNAGEYNEAANEMYGWAWTGTAKGDLDGYFFISMNYTWAPFNDGVGEIYTPTTNIVCGGSWSKVVFVGGVYQGTVSGRIDSGTITWDDKHQMNIIELKLTGTSGSDGYAGLVGTGSFSGTINRQAEPIMKGELVLNY